MQEQQTKKNFYQRTFTTERAEVTEQKIIYHQNTKTLTEISWQKSEDFLKNGGVENTVCQRRQGGAKLRLIRDQSEASYEKEIDGVKNDFEFAVLTGIYILG